MDTRTKQGAMMAFASTSALQHMFASSPRIMKGQVCMTAGQVQNSDSNPTPIRAPKPAPPSTSHKVQNRPELVGGLPLWLTVGAIGGARRFLESLNINPFAAFRRRYIEQIETRLATAAKHTEQNVEIPAARILRKVADVMEEEMTALRMALSAMKVELAQSQAQVSAMAKEVQFLRFKNTQKSDSEKELAETTSQLRFLLCKEQTRATAAEKELAVLKERLSNAEKKNRLLEADVVKVSLVYMSALVMLGSFIAESPYGPKLLSLLVAGAY